MSHFRKAQDVKKHLKVCVYGDSGAGKTHFGLSFPNPAVIDLEHGTDLFADRFGFSVFHTNTCSEVLDAVYEIQQQPDPFETLVIDPISVVWEGLQNGFIEDLEQKIQTGRSRRKEAELQFQDWKAIKRPYRRLMTLLLNLPVHVVMCGRLSYEYEIKRGELVKTGTKKMDAEKNTPYAPDILIRLEAKNKKRYGIFEKDRSGLFDGQSIENPSFETLRPILDRMNGKEQVVYGDDEEAAQKDASLFQGEEKLDPKVIIQNAQEALKKDFGSRGTEAYEKVCKNYGVKDLSTLHNEKMKTAIGQLKKAYRDLRQETQRTAA